MSEVRKPPAPAGLLTRSRKFWRATVETFELTDVELLLLGELCRTLDEIDQLHDAITADGAMVPGSKGQMRPHPGFSQIRASRALVARLASQLDLPDENGETLPSALSARGKQAARKRWAVAPPSLRSMNGGRNGAA